MALDSVEIHFWESIAQFIPTDALPLDQTSPVQYARQESLAPCNMIHIAETAKGSGNYHTGPCLDNLWLAALKEAVPSGTVAMHFVSRADDR